MPVYVRFMIQRRNSGGEVPGVLKSGHAVEDQKACPLRCANLAPKGGLEITCRVPKSRLFAVFMIDSQYYSALCSIYPLYILLDHIIHIRM